MSTGVQISEYINNIKLQRKNLHDNIKIQFNWYFATRLNKINVLQEGEST